MDITEFLLARIEEDEAQAALAMSWFHNKGWTCDEGDWRSMAGSDDLAPGWGEVMDRWNPPRVLAECAAKRQIVEAYPITRMIRIDGRTSVGSDWRGDYWEDQRGVRRYLPEDEPPGTADDVPRVLYLLALPYAGHPDFRPEWVPLAARPAS